MITFKIEINDANNYMIALTDDNESVGYLTYDYADDDSNKRNINLDFLYINHEYRKQGIGTKMINHLISLNPHVTWFSFWTGKEIEKNNGTAFHDKLGFKKVYYQEDYYEKGVGTTLYVKRINKDN